MGPRITYSREDAAKAIADSYSWAEALRQMGKCPTGGANAILRKYAEIWSIDTSHFNPNVGKIRDGMRRRKPLEEILVEGSTFNRGNLKQRLYEAGLKERECELCGQGEIWQERRMSLIIDHINGVRDDHRLENLRIVCANCAATFDTHCGRNTPWERDCARCGKTFQPKSGASQFCSMSCAKRGEGRGVPKPERRKVDRPPLDQLEADIAALGFLATGRKYGVSDNAIRKWLVFYERQAERERREAA